MFRQYLQTESLIFYFPVSEAIMANFIAYLFDSQYAATTIASITSAISFVHKLMQVQDPSETFLIKKLLQGCKKLRTQKDQRLPITSVILNQIITASDFTISNKFSAIRFKAMCSLAFHALLRVGEMTDSPNNLTYNAVQMGTDNLILQFATYKHSGSTSTHIINSKPGSASCPLHLRSQYLRSRGHRQGPLFVTANGDAVQSRTFSEELRTALNFIGLPTTRYTPHSFRIGGTSEMALQGASELQIKQAGRWASNAHLSYIRLNW